MSRTAANANRTRPAKPKGRSGDISPRQFRIALIDHGFCYLTPIDRYIDIQNPQPGRYIEPVRTARGAIHRRKTLNVLIKSRRDLKLAQAQIRSLNDRRALAAGRIVPQVLPPCRADLEGSAAIAQLADDFLTRGASSDGVRFGDLVQMGWSARQLKAHAEAARAVADRKACANDADVRRGKAVAP